MPTGDDQPHERRLDLRIRKALSEDVPFEVIHADERHPQAERHPFTVGQPHEERPNQPRPVGRGDQ